MLGDEDPDDCEPWPLHVVAMMWLACLVALLISLGVI
jgi:hypothetical protein